MRAHRVAERSISVAFVLALVVTSIGTSSRSVAARDLAPAADDIHSARPSPGARLSSLGPGTTTLVSQAGGAQGNGNSFYPAVSGNGRFIAFESYASNLVVGDTNANEDVFVHDRTDGSLSRVSVSTSGVQGNGPSYGAAISADGRYVAFATYATNLADGITTVKSQVYLRDREAGTTTLVSAGTAGTGGNGYSAAIRVAISADGVFVAYDSTATNLVASDTNGAKTDIFVWDRSTGTTTTVSVGTGGTQGNSDSYSPSVSADGRMVAFQSFATNLTFGGSNGQGQIFVRDRTAGTTAKASVSTLGVESTAESRSPAISAGGRFVAFDAASSNLTFDPKGLTVHDVYVRDLLNGATAKVSMQPNGAPSNGDAKNAVLSADGARIAFSASGDLGPPSQPEGIYVRDGVSGEVLAVSVSSSGTPGNGFSLNPSLSGDGLITAFSSRATNLVSPPTSQSQIFVNVQTAAPVAFGASAPWAFGSCPLCARSKDPVDLGTGSLTVHADDIGLPGRVLPFTFARWYNSADPRIGPLGPGWTHSYEWKLTDQGALAEIRRGDGRRDTFTRNPDGTYAPPPNVFDVLVKNANSTFTLTLTDQVVYEFSNTGRLTRIHEPAGNELTLTYTSGNLTGISDTAFRQVTLSYDTSSRLTQLQDPLGRRVTYAYDGSGRLVTVTDKIGNAAGQDPAQHQWRYAYDGATSWLTTVTDPDGRVRVRNTYDSQGRVIEQRDGLNALTTIAYGSGSTTVTDPRAHATTYTFDARLRVLTQTDVVGGSTLVLSYTYDTAGDRTSATDRNGDRTDLTYDARGNVLTKTDPPPTVGAARPVTSFAYDAKNDLTQVTDAASFVTTLSYDPTTNVLLSITRQIDATTSATTKYEYGDANNPGLPTKVIAPRGNTGPTPDLAFATTLTYDLEGNLVSRTDPDGATTTFGYDGAGRLLSFVDPDGNAQGGVPADHRWLIAYDQNDRETSRTDPLGNVLRFGYDGTGNRTSLTDRNGNVTTYAYDANTRISGVQQKPDPAGATVYTTTVGRDANGNATRITQGNGVIIDYAFDALDRLTSVTTYPTPTTPLTTSYVLDGNGQPLGRTTGDGVTTSYVYDALARLTSVSAPGLSIGYTYDALGRRTQMTDATGVTTYQYDGIGRLTQVAAPNGTLGYAYDRDGDRTALAYPGGQTVGYAFSPGGRLTTVTDWAGRSSSYSYTASGLVSRLAYPNGLVATYGYDRAQRLTDLRYTALVGAVTLAAQHFTLDADGDRTALDESALIQTTPPTLAVDHYAMTYDGLLRLTALNGTLFGGGSSSETFSYDAATNLSARTGPAATYAIDGSNRVTSDGARSFVWNGADRLVQRGADTFGYDPLGRLTSSTVAGTARTYAYDGDGLLATRTQGATTTAFLWDSSTAPAPLLVAGSDRVVHGLGPLYLARADGTTSTLVRDALGSVRAEVSDLGVIAKAFRYAAYGEIVQPNANTPTLLGYAGELRDPSGLIYLRARWYDPATARFMTSDEVQGPVNVPVSLNAYAYAYGDPIIVTDPAGACPPCLIAAVAIGVKIGLTIVDAISTAETLLDTKATPAEKVLVGGLFVAGLASSGGEASIAKAGWQALKAIGRAGRGAGVREVTGGIADARALFQSLAGNAEIRPHPGIEGGLIAQLENGGTIGFRPTSKSGPPTLDIHNVPELGVNIKIKFVPQ